MDCWSKSVQINGQWEFEPYDIEDLDYWVGKKGAEHPYHETYYRSTSLKIIFWFLDMFFKKTR